MNCNLTIKKVCSKKTGEFYSVATIKENKTDGSVRYASCIIPDVVFEQLKKCGITDFTNYKK